MAPKLSEEMRRARALLKEQIEAGQAPTFTSIGEAVGLSCQAVRTDPVCRALMEQVKREPSRTAQAYALHIEKGWSHSKAAKEYGITRGAVARFAHRLKLKGEKKNEELAG